MSVETDAGDPLGVRARPDADWCNRRRSMVRREDDRLLPDFVAA